MISIGNGVAEMKVSKLSYGCMGLTAFYGETVIPENKAIEILKTAYDLGVRHFDTAWVYQRKEKSGKVHYNEEIVGKFLKTLSEEERKEVTVATKFYPGQKFDEEWFVEATKQSLERLGVDALDLYYFHRIYPESVCKVEVWMGAAVKLIEQGLIKRIGLSEASPEVIRKANAIHPITAIQQEWSLFARDLEEKVVPTCKELGIGIISYSPIGRGFLAGSFTKKEERPKDWRAGVPYLSEENIESNLQILEDLKAMAEKKKCTTGQLCLAWVMAKGGIPIPGTTKLHHLEDNMGALNVELNKAEIEHLDELGSKVVGARGNESYMKSAFSNL